MTWKFNEETLKLEMGAFSISKSLENEDAYLHCCGRRYNFDDEYEAKDFAESIKHGKGWEVEEQNFKLVCGSFTIKHRPDIYTVSERASIFGSYELRVLGKRIVDKLATVLECKQHYDKYCKPTVEDSNHEERTTIYSPDGLSGLKFNQPKTGNYWYASVADFKEDEDNYYVDDGACDYVVPKVEGLTFTWYSEGEE